MSSRSVLAAVAVELVDGVLAACATAIPLIMLNAKSTTRILVMSLLPIVVSHSPSRDSGSVARLAVISMCAFGFRLGFGHVGTSFSSAVPLRTFAVVDVGRGI